MHFFAFTHLDVRFHFDSPTYLYTRLHMQHWLLLLVLEVDEFLFYCPKSALLLCIPCQNLVKDFQCNSKSHFQFCQALQIFLCYPFHDYMYKFLSAIYFQSNIFVKLFFKNIYILQTIRNVSVSYLYSLIPTMGTMCCSKGTKRQITRTKFWKETCMEATCYTATTLDNVQYSLRSTEQTKWYLKWEWK